MKEAHELIEAVLEGKSPADAITEAITEASDKRAATKELKALGLKLKKDDNFGSDGYEISGASGIHRAKMLPKIKKIAKKYPQFGWVLTGFAPAVDFED